MDIKKDSKKVENVIFKKYGVSPTKKYIMWLIENGMEYDDIDDLVNLVEKHITVPKGYILSNKRRKRK